MSDVKDLGQFAAKVGFGVVNELAKQGGQAIVAHPSLRQAGPLAVGSGLVHAAAVVAPGAVATTSASTAAAVTTATAVAHTAAAAVVTTTTAAVSTATAAVGVAAAAMAPVVVAGAAFYGAFKLVEWIADEW